MIPKTKTVPDFSSSSPKHIETTLNKDAHLTAWTRNVIDEFKTKTEDEIKQVLQEKAFPFAVLFENWVNDFNIASGLRNANAFNAKESFYIGNKKFDKRGMQGCQHYFNIKFLPSIDDILQLKNKYKFVAIDNMSGAIPLAEYQWQPNTMMVFGSEGVGITPQMLSLCDDMVYIPQYGSVRSLNCATASGIVMNDFVSKFVKNNN